tara:strand:- start:160 stop:1356 length:1197 start_codon:yes stop_codon:yes gene_type:complete
VRSIVVATLFSGGLIFDGKGKLREGLAVLVEDDRIAKVGPAADFEGFAGNKVDTKGATLLPGLVDCHVHLTMTGSNDPGADRTKMQDGEISMLTLFQAQETLRGGVTAVRDCGGKDYLEFAVRDWINKGRFQGPSIYASGKMICMTGGHGNRWGRVADGCDDVIKAVREQIHAGCDLVKIMATGGVMTPGVNPEDAHYSPEEMRAGVQEATRFHKRTASHAQGRDGILNAVHAGISSVEHGIFLDEICIQEMIDNGTYMVPTISALKNIANNADKGIPAYAVEKTLRISENHLASFKAFHKAGGKIALGTDAGTPFNRHGENAQELAFMVEYGMTPTEALVCGTYNGIDLMGLQDRGEIAEGKVADLLIVNGNPTEDIALAADPANHRAVYKGGELVR